MFNVDRWANYVRQNESRPNKDNRVMSEYALMTTYNGNWPVTPKQNRRMAKAARKGDTSIGMHA